jgi:hypothetical protein
MEVPSAAEYTERRTAPYFPSARPLDGQHVVGAARPSFAKVERVLLVGLAAVCGLWHVRVAVSAVLTEAHVREELRQPRRRCGRADRAPHELDDLDLNRRSPQRVRARVYVGARARVCVRARVYVCARACMCVRARGAYVRVCVCVRLRARAARAHACVRGCETHKRECVRLRMSVHVRAWVCVSVRVCECERE